MFDVVSMFDLLMAALLLIASGFSVLYVVIQATYLINDLLSKGAKKSD